MKFARIIAWTAPAAIMAALGVAGTGLRAALPETPNVNAMIGSLCAYVATGAHGKAALPPALPAALPAAEESADTSLVIHAAPPPGPEAAAASAPGPPPAPQPETEPDPVDYARLNQEVIVVAETLERFNQKLLRMIAQARAAQLRAEAQAASDATPQSPPDAAAPVAAERGP
jgi:hypothetical protein